VEFRGFPVAALDFYDDLEMDNTKSFWEAHKAVYQEAVRAPLEALCAGLAAEFGEAKVFRPYRDVRFAKDKSPYKTHQGAYVPTGPATGWYVQIAARGVSTGGGFYAADAERLGALRDAIDDDRTGRQLRRIVNKLARSGWELGGEQLKTSPRGYPADHPRVDLLRHKSLTVTRSYGFEPLIHTPELADAVRRDWRELRALLDWVGDHG